MGFATGGGFSGGGGGETNDGINLGTTGEGVEGVFADKVGTDLTFKSLVAGADINLVSDDNTITINSTAGEAVPINKVKSTTLSNPLSRYSNNYLSVVSTTINKTVVNSYLLVKLVTDSRGANPGPRGAEFQKITASGTTSSGEIEVRVGASIDSVVSKIEFPRGSNSGDFMYINDFEWILFDQGATGQKGVSINYRTVDLSMDAFFRSMSLTVEEVFL